MSLVLSDYASDASRSRGRRHAEAPSPGRDEFQRDRDRVVHSTAFRRLVYKTQVFLNHEGDLFRTRLTHSLEVAQLGRSMARRLALNEDLVEAIALAHDLGHAPFGHAGQDALNECMRGQGGFEHNLQSLRTVDLLEQRYPDFDGLNLCFETREGILKHCSHRDAVALEAVEPDGPARRFLEGRQPSLESQLTDLADEIAYNAHDIDDGVRAGLLTLEQLHEVPLVRRYLEAATRDHPSLAGQKSRRLLFEALRRLLSAQVLDVTETTAENLAAWSVHRSSDVRAGPKVVAFSIDMRHESTTLKKFLHRLLYRHSQVVQTTEAAKEVVRQLFTAYRTDPRLMPSDYADRADTQRAVADYIAGMTDRYALREHHRLTGCAAFDHDAVRRSDRSGLEE